MEGKSVFISSCSRRQMARRRPGRAALHARMLAALMVLTALVALLSVHGV